MKDKILKFLQKNQNYISGEDISKHLNVSRTAIWKHINNLKNEGYIIEGIPKKGYKLISSPNLIIKDEIINNLITSHIGRNIIHLNESSSTNESAKDLSSSNVDGTLIISNIQTNGKGRLGRVWTSPNGGIWMSLILKPEIEPQDAHKITQIAAAALVITLENLPVNAKIKWPNDLYINGKKVAGILTEMKCDMDRIHHLIVGIGINANINKEDFNVEVKDIATSLSQELNKEINRNLLIADFLNNFEKLYFPFIKENNFKKTIEICKEKSFIISKEAYLLTFNKKERVQVIGIDDEGQLIVKDENGIIKNVLSGEITFHL